MQAERLVCKNGLRFLKATSLFVLTIICSKKTLLLLLCSSFALFVFCFSYLVVKVFHCFLALFNAYLSLYLNIHVVCNCIIYALHYLSFLVKNNGLFC